MNKYYPNADEVNAEDVRDYGPPVSRRNLKRIQARLDRQISQSVSPIKIRRPLRQVGIVAACLCALLAVSITSLAIAGVMDLRGFYNSIFNNEAVSEGVLTGDALSGVVTSNGIEIQPLGAYIDEDCRAYVRLKITDLEGRRLSKLLNVIEAGFPADTWGSTVESYDGDSAVVILVTSTDGKDMDGKVSLDFDAVCLGLTPIEEQSLGVTVGDLIRLDKPMILPGLEFMELLGCEIFDHWMDISRQSADPARYGTSIGKLGLKAPDGTVLWSGFGSFGIDGVQTDGFMLDDLDPAVDPADYTLVIKGERPESVISGDWPVSFDNLETVAPRTLTAITADGQTLTITFKATITRVTLSPGYAYGSAEYKRFCESILPPDIEKPPLIITFVDNSTLPLVSYFVQPPGEYAGEMELETAFITPFILPQDIQYVSWMGEMYTL